MGNLSRSRWALPSPQKGGLLRFDSEAPRYAEAISTLKG
jgi:hypothetical protein